MLGPGLEVRDSLSMGEGLVFFVRQFRYWRAISITALVIGSTAVLWFARNEANTRDGGGSWLNHMAALQWISDSFSENELKVIAILWCLLLSGLVVSVGQVIIFNGIRIIWPSSRFDDDCREWNMWQRMFSPIELGQMAALQLRMRNSEPFRDLSDSQRHRAYQLFLEDMERARVSAGAFHVGVSDEIDRRYSDYLTALGLASTLPWLIAELAAWGGASAVQGGLVAVVVLVALLVFVWIAHRRALTVVVHFFSSGDHEVSTEYLVVNARAALDS